MLSYVVHLMNKYPGCRIDSSENSLKVWDDKQELLCAVERNGYGQWQDAKAYGARDEFSLDPIPVESRAWMLCKKDGCIKKHPDFEKRNAKGKELFKASGKVLGASEAEALKVEAPVKKPVVSGL